jgi:hypothetical protein
MLAFLSDWVRPDYRNAIGCRSAFELPPGCQDLKVEVIPMATTKQVQAAKRNVKKAQSGARKKRTIANLPAKTRRALGQQGARGRARGGKAGSALEDRNREQLYELAKRKNIPGRSKMGKGELIQALRKAG